MWRNQDRDLALLHSLLEDLKQYWQWKAVKWEKIAREVHYARAQTDEDEEVVLRRALMGDDDYRDLLERLLIEIEECKAIFLFLEYDLPEELNELDLTVALIPNEILEPVIDDLEWLLPVCKAHIYPIKHIRAALKDPRRWLNDFYEG